jgi:hypothetical protein
MTYIPVIPSFQVRTTTAVDIDAAATNNLVTWNTQDHIDSAYFTHSTSVNAGRVEVEYTGRYVFHVTLSFTSAVERYNGKVKFRVDGTTDQAPRGKSGYTRNLGSHNEASLQLSMVIDLSANSYVEVLVDREATDGGATLSSGESVFWGHLLGTRRATQ